MGEPTLPTVEGVELVTTSLSPSAVGLAGGVDLVISGAGFSLTSSEATVCGIACPVTAVTSQALTCTVPSLLLHASGAQTANFTSMQVGELDLQYTAPPPPPPGTVDVWGSRDGITLQQGKVVALAFPGLDDDQLPRGLSLRSLALRVAPQSGASGALVVDVR